MPKFVGNAEENEMNLGELIDQLKKYNPDTKVKLGFGYPHSYRGYYTALAFEPVEDTTIGEMLEHAKSALGETFEGYKGKTYLINQQTNVWLAQYSCCGEGIGHILLQYMANDFEGE